MSNIDEQSTMIDDCIARSEKLSDWELGFIDGLEKMMAKGYTLSEKQIERLDIIWNKVT